MLVFMYRHQNKKDDKHNGTVGWKGMRQMERRETFDQAQEDLN